MKIRRATSKDWLEILALIRGNPNKLMQDDLPKVGDFFVAADKGKIAGCVALSVYSKRFAEVRDLAIAKPTTAMELISKLIGSVISEAKKKKVSTILAITSDKETFEEHGFSTFKREKFALLKHLDDA